MNARESIEETYDSRDAGHPYHVTTCIDGRAVAFRFPIPDPFARTTVKVGWQDMLCALLRRRHLVVEVTVGGDRKAVDDVLELDGNTLISGSTRRQEFNQHIHDLLDMEGRQP